MWTKAQVATVVLAAEGPITLMAQQAPAALMVLTAPVLVGVAPWMVARARERRLANSGRHPAHSTQVAEAEALAIQRQAVQEEMAVVALVVAGVCRVLPTA